MTPFYWFRIYRSIPHGSGLAGRAECQNAVYVKRKVGEKCRLIASVFHFFVQVAADFSTTRDYQPFSTVNIVASLKK
jgi:hypothetical protein